LGIARRHVEPFRIVAAANKTRDDEDRAAIREYAARHDLQVADEIPVDSQLRKDIAGCAPIDETDSPALTAIHSLAGSLSQPA
jgi:MinD superfamily P-loop ATPase